MVAQPSVVFILLPENATGEPLLKLIPPPFPKTQLLASSWANIDVLNANKINTKTKNILL
jgi:hypothetical protein